MLHPGVVVRVEQVVPSLGSAGRGAVDMCPRCGANKIVGTTLVPDQRSARVAGADGCAILVCALDRIINCLKSIFFMINNQRMNRINEILE